MQAHLHFSHCPKFLTNTNLHRSRLTQDGESPGTEPEKLAEEGEDEIQVFSNSQHGDGKSILSAAQHYRRTFDCLPL